MQCPQYKSHFIKIELLITGSQSSFIFYLEFSSRVFVTIKKKNVTIGRADFEKNNEYFNKIGALFNHRVKNIVRITGVKLLL